MVAFNPDRFVGIGTVPLPKPRRAAAELKRAVTELGLRGAIISSHAETMQLGDRKLDPFWSMAETPGRADLRPSGRIFASGSVAQLFPLELDRTAA